MSLVAHGHHHRGVTGENRFSDTVQRRNWRLIYYWCMPNVPTGGQAVHHHYVPRAYLAPFTDNGVTVTGRLWVYDRESEQAPTHELLRDVGFERHLYTVPDEHGNPSAALERRLERNVERPFGRWQRTVVTARRGGAPALLDRMTRRDREAVARFVLTQHLRTPAQFLFFQRVAEISDHNYWSDPSTRAGIRAHWENDRGVALRAMTPLQRDLEFGMYFAASRAAVLAKKERLPSPWLSTIESFPEQFEPSLVDGFAWRLVELPCEVVGDTPLVTCDHPVVLARPRHGHRAGVPPEWDVEIGGGWQEPGAQMILPLSPRHALMMAQDPAALALADDPERFAASLRLRIARHALRHVYSRREDTRIGTLVQSTRAPMVVFEIAGELVPGAVTLVELLRRMNRAGVTTLGVRYADPL
jgi:hypothetical protein